jgi:glycine hydroxymethyltransferase
MTTRGLKEQDFETVAEFVDRAVKMTIDIKKTVSGTKLKDFKEAVANGEAHPSIAELKRDVVDFSQSFPVVGIGLIPRVI